MLIINNKSRCKQNILIKKFGNDIICIHSRDFKYIWSLKHLKNSGIKDSLYPQNYINKILDTMKENSNKNVFIFIDIEDEEIDMFAEAGINIDITLININKDTVIMDKHI